MNKWYKYYMVVYLAACRGSFFEERMDLCLSKNVKVLFVDGPFTDEEINSKDEDEDAMPNIKVTAGVEHVEQSGA